MGELFEGEDAIKVMSLKNNFLTNDKRVIDLVYKNGKLKAYEIIKPEYVDMFKSMGGVTSTYMNKFGEFLPDQPGFANPGVTQATNVVPVAAGYKSFNSMSSFSNAATAYLRGIFPGKGSDGTTNVFAGDATQLYKYASSDNDLDNVSKSGNYTLATADRWKFVQFGDRIIAAHGTDDILQSYVIGTSSLFADLAGSPAAQHIAVVRDFVVTGNVKYGATTYPRRVRWSGIDDATAWTIGSDQSDIDRKSTRLNSSHSQQSRMPSSS